ncbi:unnamed protein product [Urochloa decumbens]|uniref:GDSL esterase/lipase n=1 Tax=Urochloa decumbens TaxID=240449 RepID=A0ABC8V5R0_9POAL
MATTVLPQVMGVLLAAAAFACAAPSGSKSNSKVPALYVFGDSTADVGNNNYLPGGAAVPRANFPHNGVDFPTSRPTGRFSNGYNGVDFLAVHMGLKRSPPAFLGVANKTNRRQVLRGLLGVNFASAGSGILDTTGSSMIIPLSQQVAQLASLQRKMMTTTQQQGQRSVFLISTGGNDLFAFFSSRSNGSTPSDAEQQRRRFISNLVSLYEEHVKALYALGARKVAVIDVPPIGCCPYPRTLHPLGACVDALNDLASAFNKGVRDAMRRLSSSCPGLRYSVGSSHAVVQSILKHPQRLGFKDVTTACCGSGRFNGAKSGCTPNATLCRNRHDYLFWDMLHPTHAASKIAAAAIYNGSTRFATPVNLRQLLEDH